MAPFSKSVSYRLAHASKLHRARASGLLSQIGLYPGQETILKALAKGDKHSMGELAATLSVRPPTITKMVSRLASQGLVERFSRGDSRTMQVRLTERGRARAGEIDDVWRKLEKKTLAGLGDKKRKRLRKLLKKVGKNLIAIEKLAANENDER